MGVAASARPVRRSNDRGSARLDAATFARVQGGCNFINAEAARLRHQTVAIWIVALVGTVAMWLFTGAGNPRVPLLLGAGIAALAFVRARYELGAAYTDVACKRIVAAVANGLAFRPSSSLTRDQFIATDLFHDECLRFASRDEIGGRRRGTKYTIHDVRAGGKDPRATFFSGMLIRIDVPEPFPGHTVIVPDAGGHIVGALSGSGSRRAKELVMVKNPAFERMFSVYSTGYFEARQLVTPAFMQLVMDAHATLEAELRLAFTGRSLFVAVAREKVRFAPKLFGPALTPDVAVGDLARLVPLVERLIDTVS